MSAALREGGFEVIGEVANKRWLRKFFQILPDVIVIADDSPDVEKMCMRIRQETYAPILILGKSDEVKRAMMLEAGADMYADTAITSGELNAKISVLLRRYKRPEVTGICFYPEENRVELDGETIYLTPTEFRLLSYLALNMGHCIPYEQIASGVWGKDISLDTLHLYARRLKNRLGIDSVGPVKLLNLRGEGYCFRIDEAGIDPRDLC